MRLDYTLPDMGKAADHCGLLSPARRAELRELAMTFGTRNAVALEVLRQLSVCREAGH